MPPRWFALCVQRGRRLWWGARRQHGRFAAVPPVPDATCYLLPAPPSPALPPMPPHLRAGACAVPAAPPRLPLLLSHLLSIPVRRLVCALRVARLPAGGLQQGPSAGGERSARRDECGGACPLPVDARAPVLPLSSLTTLAPARPHLCAASRTSLRQCSLSSPAPRPPTRRPCRRRRWRRCPRCWSLGRFVSMPMCSTR